MNENFNPKGGVTFYEGNREKSSVKKGKSYNDQFQGKTKMTLTQYENMKGFRIKVATQPGKTEGDGNSSFQNYIKRNDPKDTQVS